MASVGVAPTDLIEPPSGRNVVDVDKLPEELNGMKIKDDKVCCFIALMPYVCTHTHTHIVIL